MMQVTALEPLVCLIAPSVELLTPTSWFKDMAIIVEKCGRTCHKSEGVMEDGSHGPFIRKVAHQMMHTSILDHAFITVRFVCSRAMSHQLVRHRIAAYSQESQRYCDYSNEKKFTAMGVIVPPSICVLPAWLNGRSVGSTGSHILLKDKPEGGTSDYIMDYLGEDKTYKFSQTLEVYLASLLNSYNSYLILRALKVPAEDARYVLPNASKTEVATTYDVTEWRHFFQMRCDKHAQWEIRGLAKTILRTFLALTPVFFEDLKDLAEDEI